MRQRARSVKSKSKSYETSFLLVCVWNQNPQHRLGRWESQSGLDLFSTSFPREVVEPIRAGDLAWVGHACSVTPLQLRDSAGIAKVAEDFEAFFAGLQQYVAGHRFGVAQPEDLLAAFESASGQDLQELWDHWFHRTEGTQDFTPEDLMNLNG